MRVKWNGLLVCALAVVGLTTLAAEKAPEAYAKGMQDIGAANMGLRGHVQAKDFDAVAKDAALFKAGFMSVQAFWEQRKVEDAIGFAKNAVKAATDLETAAKAKNEADMATAQMAVGGSCAPCHMAHRQRNQDGTNEIK